MASINFYTGFTLIMEKVAKERTATIHAFTYNKLPFQLQVKSEISVALLSGVKSPILFTVAPHMHKKLNRLHLMIKLYLPWGDMSRFTLSRTSRNSSFRLYLIPSRRHPICPVTCDVIWLVSSLVFNKWSHTKHTVNVEVG